MNRNVNVKLSSWVTILFRFYTAADTIITNDVDDDDDVTNLHDKIYLNASNQQKIIKDWVVYRVLLFSVICIVILLFQVDLVVLIKGNIFTLHGNVRLTFPLTEFG